MQESERKSRRALASAAAILTFLVAYYAGAQSADADCLLPGLSATMTIATAPAPRSVPALSIHNNIVIVPESFAGDKVSAVALALPTDWVSADGTATPTALLGDSSTVRIVSVRNTTTQASCQIMIVKGGSGVTSFTDPTPTLTLASIQEPFGVITLALAQQPTGPIPYDLHLVYSSAVDSSALHLEFAADLKVDTQSWALSFVKPTVSLNQDGVTYGTLQLVEGPALSLSPCSFLTPISSIVEPAGATAAPWPFSFYGTTLTIKHVDSANCNAASPSFSLSGSLYNGYLSTNDLPVSATFKPNDNGTTNAAFSINGPINHGDVFLSNPRIVFSGSASNATFLLQGNLALHAPSQGGELSLRFTPQGLALAGSSIDLSVNNITGTLTDFMCAYDTFRGGLQSCTGSVGLNVANLGGVLRASLNPTGFSLPGTQRIRLANDYLLTIGGGPGSISASQDGAVLTNLSATLSGGFLGNTGIHIANMALGAGKCPPHDIPGSAAALGTIGAFTLTNVNAIWKCDSKQKTSLVDITSDVGISVSPSTTGLNSFTAELKGLNIKVPFSGGAVSVLPPQSATIKGTLLGRQIVGACPAALHTNNSVLPPVTAGVATVNGKDVSNDVFRVIDPETFAVCAGIHLTPLPPNIQSTNSSDLVNAQLVFQLEQGTTGFTPTLHSARVTYVGTGQNATVTTRVGSRLLSVSNLDLSYTDDSTQFVHNDYAAGHGIPLVCEAALYGNMTMGLQSIATVGSSDTTMETQLGIGDRCIFADVRGRVTIPMGTSSSILLKELHFGSGPSGKPINNDPTAWYATVDVEVSDGKGGVALQDLGVEHFGGQSRPSINVDKARTIQMNAAWIIDGIAGLFAGLALHH